jgi:putative hydrolases of HD superfamily
MRDLVTTIRQLGYLKDVKRSGWLRAGIAQPESVADHSCRAALLALALGPRLGVNVDRLVKMLLVHDLGESDPRVGDITPFDGISPEKKYNLESTALDELCSSLPNGQEMQALWREYELGQSSEAKIAQQLDAFEMALQAFDYEKKHGLPMDEFREQAVKRLEAPLLLELYYQFLSHS